MLSFCCRFGIIMFPIPSWHKLRGIRTGWKLLENTSHFLVVEPSLSMVLFIILTSLKRWVLKMNLLSSNFTIISYHWLLCLTPPCVVSTCWIFILSIFLFVDYYYSVNTYITHDKNFDMNVFQSKHLKL